MQTCPFCRSPLSDANTVCDVCGYSLVLLLPNPVLVQRTLYLALSMLSIILGVSACAFTFFPGFYMKSLFLIIGTLGVASFTLEKAWGKSKASLVKILAVLGLALGALGYVLFMFIHSTVPGSGYTM